jgi:hypothetical protein
MHKFAIIGLLVVALAGPASASGKRAPVRPSGAQALCANPVPISPTRGYSLCGGRIWVRDPQTGGIVAVSFWRLQNMNKGPDDRP